MKVIVGVTGASGVVIAKRLLEALKEHETHLIVSEGAEKVVEFEEDVNVEELLSLASHTYENNDLAARIASSSYSIDAVVVVPCSMKTLSGIANGFCDNLIVRAAENILKLNKKLVVAPRDTPLSLAAIENMRKLKLAGAVILPPNVAYYFKPKNVSDVTDFFAGKILDAVGVEHNLYARWEGDK